MVLRKEIMIFGSRDLRHIIPVSYTHLDVYKRQTIAREIRALGFNVNFAPVADVKTSDLNTEIGERSFGSDPGKVSDMVARCV